MLFIQAKILLFFCSIWICWSSNESAALSISSDCDNFKIVHFILAVNNSFLLLLLLLFWWVFLNLMLFAFFCFALCSESWAHGLHIFRWLRHLCVQSTVINLAIKIALSTPLPSSSLVTAMSINCHHCFVGVLLVMLSSFWKCKRLCYPCHPPHMSSNFILLTIMSVIRQFSGVNLFLFVDNIILW